MVSGENPWPFIFEDAALIALGIFRPAHRFKLHNLPYPPIIIVAARATSNCDSC
jgi:hypothetical protein